MRKLRKELDLGWVLEEGMRALERRPGGCDGGGGGEAGEMGRGQAIMKSFGGRAFKVHQKA